MRECESCHNPAPALTNGFCDVCVFINVPHTPWNNGDNGTVDRMYAGGEIIGAGGGGSLTHQAYVALEREARKGPRQAAIFHNARCESCNAAALLTDGWCDACIDDSAPRRLQPWIPAVWTIARTAFAAFGFVVFVGWLVGWWA